jgi:hypothetical protein
MEKSIELSRLALVHMITGFVMFLGLGLLGYAMRLDQAGWWTFDPSLFYEIMTLHGAGMLSAALIAAIGGLIEALNGSTPLDTGYLWTAYVLGCFSFIIIILATLVGGVGAGWTMLYPLPYHSLNEWSLTVAVAAYVGYFLTAIAFLIYCTVFLIGTIGAAGSLGRALALEHLFSWGPFRSRSASEPSSARSDCGEHRWDRHGNHRLRLADSPFHRRRRPDRADGRLVRQERHQRVRPHDHQPDHVHRSGRAACHASDHHRARA